MTNEEKILAGAKLYTVVMKCAMCLRTLGTATHVEKSWNVKIDYNPCPLHTPTHKYGTVLEWQPEE